jgi:hypothetical protein
VLRAAVLLPAFVLALSSCGWTPADEQVLTRFFEESRRYDRTMLAGLATVVFDPRVEGAVDRFEIVGREPRDADGVRRQRVTVRASVRSPAGTVSERTVVMSMEERDGAWMVTGYR